jgi:thiol-disulfide isomerase/thioredoxin
VKVGQKELEVDFDLTACRLAYLVDKPAPEFREIKGWLNTGWMERGLKLSELRGKVVLLDFWGYWCGPCVASMPELMELHEKYSERGLVIIAVHDDRGSIKKLKKQLKKLSKEHWDGRGIEFAVALDGGGRVEIEGTDRKANGATTAAYGIQAWPTMVLIDKEGKVVGEFRESNDDDVKRLEGMLGG